METNLLKVPRSMGRTADTKTDKEYKYLGIWQTNENMQNKVNEETNIHQRNQASTEVRRK